MNTLKENTVEIWLAHLNNFYHRLDELRTVLTEPEIKKAERFHFAKHQKRYAVSQSILRILLGQYSKQNPKNIELAKGKYGKPYLENSNIKFNVSHSNEYAIYAFTLNDELGVDLEYWRVRNHLDGIIDSNFSELEQRLYHQLPHELKVAGFYQGWTCNEAFIKAIGMGLSFPLKDFSVEMDPRKNVRLLAAKPQVNIDVDWCLHKLACPAGYSAALAVKGRKVEIAVHDFV
jgi:4'-phosphopantetheinyl transferase